MVIAVFTSIKERHSADANLMILLLASIAQLLSLAKHLTPEDLQSLPRRRLGSQAERKLLPLIVLGLTF